MDSALRALNRFGLGARLGERQRLPAPREWLRAQLQGGPPLLAAPAEASRETITDAIRGFRSIAQASAQERQAARQRLVQIVTAESRTTLAARVASERPFVERLVAFWSNHLCVSTAGKVLVAPLAGSYEREAIRPHVLGRFEDMVLASAAHPAMLVYLDNFQSIGPGSPAARAGRGRGRGRGARGLNENYARELLELHTLGVNGGYTQGDVQELAKIITGWTVAGLAPGGGQPIRRLARGGAGRQPGGPIAFAFLDLLHEPGTKTVLGRRYADAGVGEGQDVIRALCRHPSTATFVASKLVTHFVSDAPPARAIDAVARVFRETEGDLRAVSASLIELADAWDDNSRKFRTPQDWLVAVLRAFNSGDAAAASLGALRQLRHPLWAPSSPKGFGDLTSEWSDPDSLLNRAELARTIARRTRQQRLDPRLLLDVVDRDGADALARLVADTSIAADERIALALASPAFQWR